MFIAKRIEMRRRRGGWGEGWWWGKEERGNQWEHQEREEWVTWEVQPGEGRRKGCTMCKRFSWWDATLLFPRFLLQLAVLLLLSTVVPSAVLSSCILFLLICSWFVSFFLLILNTNGSISFFFFFVLLALSMAFSLSSSPDQKGRSRTRDGRKSERRGNRSLQTTEKRTCVCVTRTLQWVACQSSTMCLFLERKRDEDDVRRRKQEGRKEEGKRVWRVWRQ